MEHIEHPDITAMERDGELPDESIHKKVILFGGLVYRNRQAECEEYEEEE